jgi:hypothetical protein
VTLTRTFKETHINYFQIPTFVSFQEFICTVIKGKLFSNDLIKIKDRDIGVYRKRTQILQSATTTGRIPPRSAALHSTHQCSNFQTLASNYYYEKMILHADPSERDSKELTQ